MELSLAVHICSSRHTPPTAIPLHVIVGGVALRLNLLDEALGLFDIGTANEPAKQLHTPVLAVKSP